MALLDCRGLGPVPYETAWELQKRLVDALLAERQRREEAAAEENSSSPRRRNRPVGALILLQHEPVYPLGAGATTENQRFDPGRAFREGERKEAAAEQQRSESESGGASSSSSSSATPPLPPPPAPLHRVERGGEVTWHGPGQLVLYPILDLRAGEEEEEKKEGEAAGGEGGGERGGKGGGSKRGGGPFLTDLHWYLRALEEVAVSALARLPSHPLLLIASKGGEEEEEDDEKATETAAAPPSSSPRLLLAGEREEGLTGVWVGGRKVAALGVRAARWATYHGLALNVNADLAYFEHIVPCGIQGREVASVVTAWEEEVRRLKKKSKDNRGEKSPFELPASWKARPGEGPLVAAAGDALLAAFCDVLGVRLESVGEEEVPRELLLLPRSSSSKEKEKEEDEKKKEAMVSFAEHVVRGDK